MAPPEKTDKATSSWSTHDNACSHCRERKIRCGRERPDCANCKRDGAECEYSTPGKRVNHIKLLCNNVGGLEDRLSNIEAELSYMNTLLKANGHQGLAFESKAEDDDQGTLSADDHQLGDDDSVQPKDRHIVRSSSNLTDHYYGPCTLFALCSEFCETLLSAERAQSSGFSGNGSRRNKKKKQQNDLVLGETARSLLARMSLEAGAEDSSDLQSEPIPIQLPPKQFLMMAQTQFFQQVDHVSDIFVQSCFWSNVESVYSRPFTPADEAWAICFNTIILFVLGSASLTQDCDAFVGSQFIRPFLLIVRSAIHNHRILMAPKLVNVQALALLSIAAQKYYPFACAESIFAQACVLARTMGLHQYGAREDVGSEEALERFKVFRSLFVRDKSFAVSQGSICWLPSFDCSLSSELTESVSSDSGCAARIQLARLQDNIYRLFHSENSRRRGSAKYKSELLRVEQGLEHWVNTHKIFGKPANSGNNIDLQLEFLAARICVFRKSDELNRARQALRDARASCLLLLMTHCQQGSSMTEQLDDLLSPHGPPKSSPRRPPTRTNAKIRKSSLPDNAKRKSNSSVRAGSHNTLDTVSVAAFFLLASNIIQPSAAYDESQANDDLQLLEKTCACYTEVDARTQANNHARKVGQAFQNLLEVTNLIRASPEMQSPRVSEGRQSSKGHNGSSTESSLAGQLPVSMATDLPSPSLTTTSMPGKSWDFFSNTNAALPTPDSPGAASMAAAFGSLNPQLQPFDQFPGFFPPQQQQSMRVQPSFHRQESSPSDAASIEMNDSRLFSEYLASNGNMPF